MSTIHNPVIEILVIRMYWLNLIGGKQNVKTSHYFVNAFGPE